MQKIEKKVNFLYLKKLQKIKLLSIKTKKKKKELKQKGLRD